MSDSNDSSIKVEEQLESFLSSTQNVSTTPATKEEEEDLCESTIYSDTNARPKEEEDLFGISASAETQVRRPTSSAVVDGTDPTDTSQFTHRFSLKPSSVAPKELKEGFTVVYTCSLTSLSSFIDELPAQAVLGFSTKADGVIVQLCCLETRMILVFRMPIEANQTHRETCSAAISDVFGLDKYMKVSMAAFDHALKLNRFYNVTTSEIFDLYFLAKDLEFSISGDIAKSLSNDYHCGIAINTTRKYKSPSQGLARLRKDLIGFSFDYLENLDAESYHETQLKGKRLDDQNWIRYPISLGLLFEAAKEALFGVLAYNALMVKFDGFEIAQYKVKAKEQLTQRLSKPLTPEAQEARLRWERNHLGVSSIEKTQCPESISTSTRKDTPDQSRNNKSKRKHPKRNAEDGFISLNCDVKPDGLKKTKFERAHPEMPSKSDPMAYNKWLDSVRVQARQRKAECKAQAKLNKQKKTKTAS